MLISRKQKKTQKGKFLTLATATLAIGAIGLIAGGVGTAVQMEAQSDISKASKRAEELRRKQMRLEGARERRKQIRQSLLQRAGVINSAANQGAIGSSAQVGGAGSAVSTAGGNIHNINESQEIGEQMFDVNQSISSSRSKASTGSAIANFGFSTAANAQKTARVGSQLFNL